MPRSRPLPAGANGRGGFGVTSFTKKLIASAVCVAAVVALVAYYVVGYLMVRPPAVAASTSVRHARITIQTVPSIGFGPHPDWVSYLARNPQGKWVHSTVFKVPAHSLVTMTVYQFDTATGLRNPYWGGPQGLVGEMKINGKPTKVLDPDLASHTFAVPDLAVTVPLPGVADNAKNQCSVAPCTLSQAHQTIVFTFRTGDKGTFRWQCFVPCAAGFILGNGGPMQSIGYMDGYLQVA
jgi:hypothetical protein